MKFDELKSLKRWVAFDTEKTPVNPVTGYNASSTDSTTWGTYDEAKQAVTDFEINLSKSDKRVKLKGVGFMLGDGFYGVDFDHVVKMNEYGEPTIEPYVEKLILDFNSYCEFSPSGTGIHIICTGTPDGGGCKETIAEMYTKTRYFTVTENPVGTIRPVNERSFEGSRFLKFVSAWKKWVKVLEKHERALRVWNGDISDYADDHSSADMAVISMMLIYINHTGEYTDDDMKYILDRLYRMSGLYISMKTEQGLKKWDKNHTGENNKTYGELTIEKVITKPFANAFYEGDNGKLFRRDLFADFFRNKHHCMRFDGDNNYDDRLYMYDETEGVYTCKQKTINSKIREYLPLLGDGAIREIRLAVDEYTNIRKMQIADDRYIYVHNGIIDLNNGGALIGFTPDIAYNMAKIPWDYIGNDAAVYDEGMDKALDAWTCGDKELRKLLLEMTGYCLYRRNKMKKVFFLVGDGDNGKSAFIEVLEKLLGKQNFSTIDFRNIGARFSMAGLENKLANICDDIGDAYVDDLSLIKMLSSGADITVEHKGVDSYSAVNMATLVFGANTIPPTKAADTAGVNRLMFLPFNAKFTEKDPLFVDRLTTDKAMSYLLHEAVKALMRVIETRVFTTPDCVEQKKQEYIEGNDPVLQFLDDHKSDCDMKTEETKAVFLSYATWCKLNGYMPMKRKRFNDHMVNNLGYRIKQIYPYNPNKGKADHIRVFWLE